jgi:poly-gamma-glutamate capsule biosynthesis protein CapA/YwtB (metallophosphatase superfamily)
MSKKIYLSLIGLVIIVFSASFLFIKGTEIPNITPKEIIQDITPPKKSVSMIFAGDIMATRGVEASVNKNFAGDYNALFENLGFIKTFDIAFANLEGPSSDKGRNVGSKFSFRMNPKVLEAIKGAGIDILSIANNHMGDWTVEAFKDTITRLKENGILFAGGGMNTLEAETPTIIEKNGIKIGFLAFSDVGPIWMQAKENTPGILIAETPRFPEIIQNASKQVDFLIVSFHYGDEYKPIHNERQEILSRKAVDNGAKLVIGHHPHVIEDTEVYKGGFIAYSLGNFIFDQSWSEPTMKGMLLEVKLNEDGNMTVKKNTTQLNKFYQVESVNEGIEEEVQFQE